NRLADQAEVIAKQRRREPLHELGRLAQLHLKDDGKVAVLAEAGEMAARQTEQAFTRIAQVGNGGAPARETVAHAPLEDRDEQVVLALEVEVHRAGSDAGRAGDV